MERSMRIMVFLLAMVLIGGLVNLLIEDRVKDSYINRAVIANALSIASRLKVQVESYYFENGELPYSNFSLGLPEPEKFSGQGIKRVEVEDLGVIHLVIAAADTAMDGHIFLIPQELDSGQADRWLCLTPSYSTIQEFVPQCQYKPVDG